MKNVLFALAGIVLGFAGGFLLTNSLTHTSGVTPNATAVASSTAPPLDAAQIGGALPPNHPSLDGTTTPQGGAAASSASAQSAMQAADTAPTDFNKQMEAAIVFYQAGDFPKASLYLERAIKLRPNETDAHVALGDTRYDAGDYAAAQAAYEQALKLNATDANVRTDLGNTFYLRGDYARAIAEYERSLQIDARHEKTLQNMALAQIKANRIDDARRTIERLAQVNPQNAGLNSLRAQAGL